MAHWVYSKRLHRLTDLESGNYLEEGALDDYAVKFYLVESNEGKVIAEFDSEEKAFDLIRKLSSFLGAYEVDD